jgi:hypothetical protein
MRRVKSDLLYGPLASRAVTSASMKGLFAPCEGVEKAAPGQESGRGYEKGER